MEIAGAYSNEVSQRVGLYGWVYIVSGGRCMDFSVNTQSSLWRWVWRSTMLSDIPW